MKTESKTTNKATTNSNKASTAKKSSTTTTTTSSNNDNNKSKSTSKNTEDEMIKQAAVGAAVAGATKSTSFKQKCIELFQVILWGEEGAKHFQLKMSIVVGVECIFLAGVLIDAMCGGALKEHGIRPRDFPMGFMGIFFAPFLHKNIFHLLMNCVPFGILSMLVLLRPRGISTYFMLTGITILVAGTLVWALGSTGSNHIGSSELIFSYFGYLVVSGLFRKSIRDFVIGASVFLLYSSIFWGVLPIDERISWEAHLFGLFCGCAFGFVDARLFDHVKQAVAQVVDDDDERQKLIP